MAELKVQKIGDQLAVVLPEEIVRQFGLHEGSSVSVTTEPQAPAAAGKLAIAMKIASRYRNTLHELSK